MKWGGLLVKDLIFILGIQGTNLANDIDQIFPMPRLK
jgi:hypothetical protein